MKKPEITEGPWSIGELDEDQFVYDATGSSIATEIQGKDLSEAEANTQAISDVPDMIEALIEARSYMNIKKSIFNEQYPDYTPHNLIKKLEVINKALKKAGVEL